MLASRLADMCSASLSARRAWIEIIGRSVEFHLFASLSARRAWIEIDFSGSAWVQEFPSLSARRAWIEIVAIRLAVWAYYQGRSPQGERG